MLLHKQTFQSCAHAVVGVDCWASEAVRDGLELGDLFAVVDSRDNDAVEAAIASRAYCRQTFAGIGVDGTELLRALERSATTRGVLQVLMIGAKRAEVTPLEPLSQWARGAFAEESKGTTDGG